MLHIVLLVASCAAVGSPLIAIEKCVAVDVRHFLDEIVPERKMHAVCLVIHLSDCCRRLFRLAVAAFRFVLYSIVLLGCFPL